MNLEFMKDLMGDSYKEGITLDEVKTFMEGKKFADLSTGKYVDSDKYNNAISSMNDLQNKLKTANETLQTKMSDDERALQAQKDKDTEIERLKQLLSANTITGNKNIVVSELSNSRDTLELDVNDSNFQSFVDNITSEDTDTSTNIAKYVSKLVKDAYEKGKQDSTKEAMGNFGRTNPAQPSNNGAVEIGDLGKQIAQATASKRATYDYFK